MNVSLTPELETLVHEKVGSGMYTSASEVVREALRLLKERDAWQTPPTNLVPSAEHQEAHRDNFWDGFVGMVESDGSRQARDVKQVVAQAILEKHAAGHV